MPTALVSQRYFTPTNCQRIEHSADYCAKRTLSSAAPRTVENVANKIFINRLALDFSGHELINLLRPEAYLSLENVLRNSGISTQSPRDLTCVTTGEPGRFSTSTLSIRYRHISPRLFWGFHPKRTRYGRYNLAEPEKALLDWIYLLRQEGSIVPTDELDLTALDINKLLTYAKKFPKPVRQQVLELLAQRNAMKA